jgi:formylglycine-generating enzyme required for sulfatase activity/serine/threonine protein kinase
VEVVGETLNDRYRIERRLAGGSQAEVFLATDSHMERQVAIKIWKPEGGFTVDEFLREAKLLARFGAPHFVTIHEHAATIDRRPFFVLEYLQGETLQDLSTPLTVNEIRRCVRDVCVGLQKAHDEGVVHRDLKPSNIMVVGRQTRTERYVILDLGIAKITDGSNWRRTLTDATMAGAGTLLYMSPEQCMGNPIDRRTDIYAFGCLLYTLLVGEEPFAHKGSSYLAVMNAIIGDPPRRLSEVRPEGQFSEELEQLVADCLAKKQDDRPASMSDVEARFEECFADELPLTDTAHGHKTNAPGARRTERPTGSSTHPNRPPKRRGLATALVALLVLAAAGVGYFAWRLSPEIKTVAGPDSKLPSADDPKPSRLPPEKVALSPPQVEKKSSTAIAPAKPVEKSLPPEKQAERKPEQKPATPSSPPVVKTPIPLPVNLNDDRYVVVRDHPLKADDAAGKNKDANLHGVLANDELPTGKLYEVDLVRKPQFGAFTLNGDGTFIYASAARPGGEFVRFDSFKYRVRASNHDPWSEPANVTIAIHPYRDEELAAVKRIGSIYGDASIRIEQNPPAVQIDFSEPIVHKLGRDEALNDLDGLVEVLHELRLDSQPITDRGLEHLARFGELQFLSLAGTDISDTGLAKVAALKKLSEIDLSDTLVTEAALKALADRKQAPPLRVARDGTVDRLRRAGVAISAKSDATLRRNGFIAAIPQAAQLSKVVSLLKEAPRLFELVIANPNASDDLVSESLVRQLAALKVLDLRGTIVSPQRVDLLKKQFPGLQLKWDPPLAQLRLIGTVKEIAPGKEAGSGGVAIDLARKKIDARTWILLSQVPNLMALNLAGVAIDDVFFDRLVQLTTLRELNLQETSLDGQRLLELCQRLPALVSLDVQKSSVARDKIKLRALLAELRSRDRKATLQPEPVDEGPDLLTAPFNEDAATRARALWAAYLNSPEQMPNSLGMKLQLIPPGEFRMGSEETYLELVERFPGVREAEEENPVTRLGLESARPQRTIRITRPYYLAAQEVTNGQFKKFVEATHHKADPEPQHKQDWGYPKKHPKGPRALEYSGSPGRGYTWQQWGVEINEQAPVVDVSWNDAVAFCDWLSRKEGKTYRLPTEAEWEYACRAGTTTRYWNGDDPERLTAIANVRDLAARQKYGWPNTLSSSDGSASASGVGHYPPNNFGLYDMHGNAAEWCSDWFSTSYYREPPLADPTGPPAGALHVVRGGSWHSAAIFCRSAHRTAEVATHRSNHIGFRVVCVETRPPWPPARPATASPPLASAPAPLVAPFKDGQIAEARQSWSKAAHLDERATNIAGLTMILVPPGEFSMGSTQEQLTQVATFTPNWKPESAKAEQPPHRVAITRPFYLAAHEVTRGQFGRFVKATDYKTICERAIVRGVGWDAKTGKFKNGRKYNWRHTDFPQDDTHPVVNVSWRDAAAFCTWLTWKEGKLYRLPTEAEWEYACRAGTTTLFSSGDDPEGLAAIANVSDETAKGKIPGGPTIKGRDGFLFTAPVGSFAPNGFGLFDMHGNVRELCGDWFADDYYANSPDADPHGFSTGDSHVIRGGGWNSSAAVCRCAARGSLQPSSVDLNLGFRVVAETRGE